jgi:hypothetical protein
VATDTLKLFDREQNLRNTLEWTIVLANKAIREASERLSGLKNESKRQEVKDFIDGRNLIVRQAYRALREYGFTQ